MLSKITCSRSYTWKAKLVIHKTIKKRKNPYFHSIVSIHIYTKCHNNKINISHDLLDGKNGKINQKRELCTAVSKGRSI